MNTHARSWFPMIWEVPLALPSFALFHALRRVLALAAKGRARSTRANPSAQWGTMSATKLKRQLPVIMLVGPRWNTHAALGSMGPTRVERRLVLDVESASRSADQWSCALTRMDRTVARTIGNGDLTNGEKEIVLDVEPDTYVLTMRYYGTRPGAAFPELTLDDGTTVPALEVPQDSLDVYERVRGFSGAFYAALAWYIYPMLRLRRWLSERFVTGEVLPFGNPQTTFLFDAVERGERLRIEVPESVLATHKVMFTAYNRASFPTSWFSVASPTTETEPMARQGFWLMRLHPLGPGAPHIPADQIRVTAGS